MLLRPGVILATNSNMRSPSPSLLHLSGAWRIVAALLLASARVGAQDAVAANAEWIPRTRTVDADTVHLRSPAQKTLFVKRDLLATGIAIAGTAAVSGFDRRVARW